MALAFAVLIVMLVVVGSLLIMADLNDSLMPGPELMNPHMQRREIEAKPPIGTGEYLYPAASRIMTLSISASTLAMALPPRSWPISINACASLASSRTVT